ncbi:MAG: biotin--[acetyl-CoA-carboxylase] ligase [Bacilli bacterium]|nr:biotin--[acetyl-CoA-carboxylase] ligase [Bacilli bacterium]
MRYLYLPRVSSTNTYLKSNYQKLDNWTILRADYQEKGRGRLNHVWKSHKGENLLCSILIKDEYAFKEHESLCLLVGVSVYRLLKDLGIKNVKIKLPNDVYVNNKKICGILIETIFIGSKLKALVIGIGLNLNQKSFPKTLKATSTYLVNKKIVNIDKTQKDLVKIIQEELKKVSKDYYKKLLKQYKSIIYSSTL